MEVPSQARLRIWTGAARTPDPERIAPPESGSEGASSVLPANPETYFSTEALYPARGRKPNASCEPYSLGWYESIEQHRYGRNGKWIPRLMEFSKHSGETLLGLGRGLGTDWLQYARHGANVVVVGTSGTHLELTRRNFELRKLPGRFLHSSSASLPFENSSVDVVCMSNRIDPSDDAAEIVREIYRVLKPGGKVLAVMPARYDVNFWFSVCFPWTRLLGMNRPETDATEHKFSRKALRRLFGDYVEHRIHKRQLCRGDIPHIWRWAPRPVMERIMGRLLVLKAFKPVRAAIVTSLAA